jgi:hypothetical protein
VKRDDGAIVLGWLTKVALTLAVVGFLAYDGISIVVATFATSDHANTYASEAADSVKQLRSVDKAYAAISAEAEDSGYSIAPQDFRVASDGNVTIILHRTAHSLWMDKIGALKKYLNVKGTGTGAPAS